MMLDEYDKRFLERLYKKRSITTTGCWEWTGSLNENDYGLVNYYGKTWKIHRITFCLLKQKEWNKDLSILHKCNNRKCFNPDHLYIGTKEDNMLDAVTAKTLYNTSKTSCPRGHEYTVENTRLYRGRRFCKECQRDVNKRRYAL